MKEMAESDIIPKTKGSFAMAPRLTDDMIEKNLRCCTEDFRKVKRMDQRGVLSDRDRRDQCSRIFRQRFFRFLESAGLHYRITHENVTRFSREYEMRQPSEGPVWLSAAEGREEREASWEDRNLFFVLADAFLLPLDFFLPPPDGVKEPRLRRRIYGTTAIPTVIDFSGGSDGGLSSDPSPAGKVFELKDRFGLRARLSVIRTEDADGRTFLCTGTAEGYTSQRKREIRVHFKNGSLFLHTDLDSDDEEALRSFPLWREYRIWLEKRNAMLDELLKKQYIHYSKINENE